MPLTFWCFGVRSPLGLTWTTAGRNVPYWYTLRLEHIHTLPQPWTLEDDFKRVLAWRKLGADDWLDLSVPWSVGLEVRWKDSQAPAGAMDGQYPVMI